MAIFLEGETQAEEKKVPGARGNLVVMVMVMAVVGGGDDDGGEWLNVPGVFLANRAATWPSQRNLLGF